MTELEIEEITISQKNNELISNLIDINRYAESCSQSSFSVSDYINTNLLRGYKDKRRIIPVGYKKSQTGDNEAVITLVAEYSSTIHDKHTSGSFILEVLNKQNNLKKIINLQDIDSVPKTIAAKDLETVLVKDIRQVDDKDVCKYAELVTQMAKAYKLLPLKRQYELDICFYENDVLCYRTISLLSALNISESLFEIIKESKSKGIDNAALNDFACSTYSIINILNTENLYQPEKKKMTSVLYL